jgi:hypothetical protein
MDERPVDLEPTSDAVLEAHQLRPAGSASRAPFGSMAAELARRLGAAVEIPDGSIGVDVLLRPVPG